MTKLFKKVEKPHRGVIFWLFLPKVDFSLKNLALSKIIPQGPQIPYRISEKTNV